MSDTPDAGATAARDRSPFPRENIVRFLSLPADTPRHDLELRAAPAAADEASQNANGMPTLFGHFTVFGRWTEIDSWYEGNFLERVAAGSFKKTFRELTPKVL